MGPRASFSSTVTAIAFVLLAAPFAHAQFVQQGIKLQAVDGAFQAFQGYSVSVAADGNSAVVGGWNDGSTYTGANSNGRGAGYIYTRTGGVWSQLGTKLQGAGTTSNAEQGKAVAMSADGNTVAIGGPADALNASGTAAAGAVWIFVKSNGAWVPQGSKLVASNATGLAFQGSSVALSTDGNTLIEGGLSDNNGAGAAWIFTRDAGGNWTQQAKLVGTGALGAAAQGTSVSISADGNTAIIGGPADNNNFGAVWVFTRSGTTWTQQGGKLLPSDWAGNGPKFGNSCGLSSDGSTAVIGGPADAGNLGAAWVFVRSGSTWSQQGLKMVGIGGSATGQSGYAVAISGDGNTIVSGAPYDGQTQLGYQGGVWFFRRVSGSWHPFPASATHPTIGTGSDFETVNVSGTNFNYGPSQGFAVALSADSSTAFVGGPTDAGLRGSTWVYAQPRLIFSTPAFVSTGVPFGFTITVVDSSGNQATSYIGTVHFTSTDPNAILPPDTQLFGGSATLNVTLNSVGNQTISAADTTNPGLHGTSSVIGANLSAGVVTHLSVTAPATAAAGTPVSFTVTALNAANAVVNTYSNSVKFTSSDPTAGLPPNTNLSNGTGTFSATLNTSGTQTITATDVSLPTLNGTSGGIAVGSAQPTLFSQQGNKLVGTGASGASQQGASVALSADGNTAIAGAPGDSASSGAAWVYTRFNSVWSQQGAKLAGTGSSGSPAAGPVSLSADGNTAILGGPGDGTVGASWIFVRSGGGWTQQGPKLVPSSASAGAQSGSSVAVSADGNTAIIGGPGDASSAGAAWIFVRSNNSWAQQAKLTGTGAIGAAQQGWSVALSGDGNTAILGGLNDNGTVGAVWVFTRSGTVWTQQGVKITGSGAAGGSQQGSGVALSTDGNTAAVGGRGDNGNAGALWIYTRDGSGTWTQQGSKLTGTGAAGAALMGGSVSLSGDGNTVVAGGSRDNTVNSTDSTGAAWVFRRKSGAWSQLGGKLTGTGSVHGTVNGNPAGPLMGSGVAISSDGATVLAGGPGDNSNAGAVWAFALPHFSFTNPATVNLNNAFNFSVSALDANNTVLTSYSGIVHFTSTDGIAVLPADANLSAGVGLFAATFRTNGNQTLTATDTNNPAIKGTSNLIGAGPVAQTVKFSVTTPTFVTAGIPFNVTINAQDSVNNTAPGYNGTVHFTSVDTAAVLPMDANLTAGVGTFQVTLKTLGQQMVSVNDVTDNTIRGSSGLITVGASPATHFAISAPTPATAGSAFVFVVTAQDAFNNRVSGYTGTVHFTSSDPQAVLSADTNLSNGTGTLGATLKTSGAQTITGTDTANGAIKGTSNTITVNAGATTRLTVTANSPIAAGTSFNFTVTSQDAFGNTAPGYAGIVHLFSSDPAAILPADINLVAGARIYTGTLTSAGSQTISAADTVNASIKGTSSPIVVTAGAPTHFAVATPSPVFPGLSFSFSVAAQDAFNNTAAGYSGTAHFTSTDPNATLPPDGPLSAGLGTFSATLRTPGNQTITVSDASNPAIQGVSFGISVINHGTPSPVSVSPGAGNSASAPMTFTFTDTAGYQDMGVLNILVNNALDGRHACYLAYSVPLNTLFLVDDAGDGGGPFAGGGVLNGTAGSIQNSQCTVSWGASPVSAGGPNLALTLTVAFKAAFGGNKVIYMAARNAVDTNSGWSPLGVWQAPGAASTGTTAVVGMTPNSGSGQGPTTYTFNFADTKGNQDIGVANVLINNSIDGGNACYLAFARPSNALFLVNDAGTALSPSQSLAASGSVSNSQCAVSWTALAVSAAGNNISLTLSIQFKAAFNGSRVFYLAVRDVNEANNTDWQSMAAWVVK